MGMHTRTVMKTATKRTNIDEREVQANRASVTSTRNSVTTLTLILLTITSAQLRIISSIHCCSSSTHSSTNNAQQRIKLRLILAPIPINTTIIIRTTNLNRRMRDGSTRRGIYCDIIIRHRRLTLPLPLLAQLASSMRGTRTPIAKPALGQLRRPRARALPKTGTAARRSAASCQKK
jgi:hypothetical protein